jgi:hypothetical protein
MRVSLYDGGTGSVCGIMVHHTNADGERSTTIVARCGMPAFTFTYSFTFSIEIGIEIEIEIDKARDKARDSDYDNDDYCSMARVEADTTYICMHYDLR